MRANLPLDLGEHCAYVVVGASGTIGRALCIKLMEIGSRVVAIDYVEFDRDFAARRGTDLLKVFTGDATDPLLLKSASEYMKKMNLNTAGLVLLAAPNPAPQEQETNYALEQLRLGEFLTEVDAHLGPAMACIRQFGPSMARRGDGSIVIVSSDLGLLAPDQSLYSHFSNAVPTVKPASYVVGKHGVIGLAKYVSTYWGGYGVRCNAVAPGPIESPHMDSQLKEKLLGKVPLGRLAKVNEVIEPIIFLLSKSSAFITGTVIMVDGGRSAW